jgi:hypothetical protein
MYDMSSSLISLFFFSTKDGRQEASRKIVKLPKQQKINYCKMHTACSFGWWLMAGAGLF